MRLPSYSASIRDKKDISRKGFLWGILDLGEVIFHWFRAYFYAIFGSYNKNGFIWGVELGHQPPKYAYGFYIDYSKSEKGLDCLDPAFQDEGTMMSLWLPTVTLSCIIVIVIIISKLLKRYSKAKRIRAPAYSRALRRIKGGFPKGGQEKLRSEFQSTRRGQSSC